MNSNNFQKFRVHDDLKSRLKAAGLTSRECANAVEESPTTINNRLNGFLPLPADKTKKLERLINLHNKKQKQDRNDYIKSIKNISSHHEMLKEIVAKVDEGMFGNDPYYARIKDALINQAKDIIKYIKPQQFDSVHEIESCLVVSTAHITSGDNVALDNKSKEDENSFVYKDTYYYLLRIDDSIDPINYTEFSDELIAIIKMTMSIGCNYLKLDGDGNVYNDLPTFNW